MGQKNEIIFFDKNPKDKTTGTLTRLSLKITYLLRHTLFGGFIVMVMAKRIFLFLALNFVVVMTISFLLNIFGVGHQINRYGLNYTSLAIICLVWGMGGAFISLALSRKMAKWTMGVKLIDPQTQDQNSQQVLQMVYRLAQSAGLTTMPEVGIYESQELNAFATGPTKARSLVAISSGLLNTMNQQEVEGVIGHELTHVANGDMVTMTLLQGVINAFVLFLSRVLAFAIAQALRGDRGRGRGLSYPIYYLVQIVLQIVFMILGSLIVAWFSRYREYRADAGGARIAGRQNMIAALQVLQRNYEIVDPKPQAMVKAFGISSGGKSWLQLFSSHPPLSDRIERLQKFSFEQGM